MDSCQGVIRAVINKASDVGGSDAVVTDPNRELFTFIPFVGRGGCLHALKFAASINNVATICN